MRISKIKIDAQGVMSVSFNSSIPDNEKPLLVDWKHPGVAPKNILKAIDKLKSFVGDIIELPTSKHSLIEVRGVIISQHPKTNSTGYIFTALKHLEKTDAPYVINTPLKYDTAENENTVLSQECLIAVKELQDLVLEYIQKSVAEQLDLFNNAA